MIGLLALVLSLPGLSALSAPAPSLPALAKAESAILIEAETGTILYAYHPDVKIPPASLTKLITLEIALNMVESGSLELNQVIVPVQPAWATSMAPHSSLMFLGPNQHLTVDELLKGLIVDSGNDAAYEVAYLIAGSVPAFAELMNAEVAQAGFPGMHFVEPSGLSARNVITAREFAGFCRRFIHDYPDALGSYFLRSFTYPKPSNMDPGSTVHPITQYSRNVLLRTYPGADGLKTGYITESGYNIATTAVRNGMRLISVVLGIQADNGAAGERLMTADSEELLNYGFDNFAKVTPSYPDAKPVSVWKGQAPRVVLSPKEPPVIVVPKGEAGSVSASVSQAYAVLAPVRAGQELGEIVLSADGKAIASVPLVSRAAVAEGGLPLRLADSVVLFVRRLFGTNPISAWQPTRLPAPGGPPHAGG
jgi:serine-type D-Ala-D-Ala carboxypeptidase (penicillin-binding protein 5/6)